MHRLSHDHPLLHHWCHQAFRQDLQLRLQGYHFQYSHLQPSLHANLFHEVLLDPFRTYPSFSSSRYVQVYLGSQLPHHRFVPKLHHYQYRYPHRHRPVLQSIRYHYYHFRPQCHSRSDLCPRISASSIFLHPLLNLPHHHHRLVAFALLILAQTALLDSASLLGDLRPDALLWIGHSVIVLNFSLIP